MYENQTARPSALAVLLLLTLSLVLAACSGGGTDEQPEAPAITATVPAAGSAPAGMINGETSDGVFVEVACEPEHWPALFASAAALP